jgi:hypothetical protein
MKIALGIGGAAILAVGALYWRLDAVSSQRDTALAERDKALHGLEMVLSERDRADAIVSALNDRLDAIRADSRQTRQAISELERNHEDIRDLLDTRLPLDLAGVLWADTPSAGSDSVDPPARTRAPVQSGRSAPD